MGVKLGLSRKYTDYGVCKNRVLRRVFGLKRDEVTRGWKRCIMINYLICTLHHIIRVIKSRRMR
jgi:hypothetical protein